MHVSVLNGKFAISCNFFENERVMAMPRREFKKKFKLWACAATYDNAKHLLANFKPEEMDNEVLLLAAKIIDDVAPKPIKDELPPSALAGLLPHQQNAIKKAWGTPTFAILHRPRLRKTATTIRLACARFMAGQIDRLVVFAPNSIKEVWKSEFSKRSICPYDLHVYDAENKKKYLKWRDSVRMGSLVVLVVGIESMSTEGGQEIVKEFLARSPKERCMAAVDESTRIANHKSNRTKALWGIGGDYAYYRNILTGSEITRAIEQMFAQFRFLGVHVLEFDSFYAWRNRYCLMGGFEGKRIVGMRNGEELLGKISKYADLVKTTDVVPMPEKSFTRRLVKPTPEQKEILKTLEKEMWAEFEGREINLNHVMVMQLRAQQVTGGHFPAENADEGTTDMIPLKTNPKMEELMSILDEEDGKVVIWARFIPEIEAIVSAISKKFGPESVVSFYGAIKVEDRFKLTQKFQTDPKVIYMVANAQAAGMGQEMSAADVMVWYSQDYNYENRVQALERCTNLDKLVGTGVIDLVMDVKADHNVQHSNEQKKDLAEYVEDSLHGSSKEFGFA